MPASLAKSVQTVVQASAHHVSASPLLRPRRSSNRPTRENLRRDSRPTKCSGSPIRAIDLIVGGKGRVAQDTPLRRNASNEKEKRDRSKGIRAKRGRTRRFARNESTFQSRNKLGNLARISGGGQVRRRRVQPVTLREKRERGRERGLGRGR